MWGEGRAHPRSWLLQTYSLDLKSDVDDKVGELTIRVTSSLASIREALKNAEQAAKQLDPTLAVVNDPIQAIAPLATVITDWASAWQLLGDRLAALVEVANAVV
jgi:signal transduction histidine kinase